MPDLHSAIEQLRKLKNPEAQRRALRAGHPLCTAEGLDKLCEEVIVQARSSPRRIGWLSQVAGWVAQELGDEHARALALRAAGHVAYARNDYAEAVKNYQAACAIFRSIPTPAELGRTLSSAVHSLIYLGRYEQAMAWATEARSLFEQAGDTLRLARLDSNTGNILYRQDRFEEALEYYRRAYTTLLEAGTAQDITAVLSNLAVCYISLSRFEEALEAYSLSRSRAQSRSMPVLVAEADYNIAYLYFLRGEYDRAIALYRSTRIHCRKLGDPYHLALCDLDQAELYLELNLIGGAENLARRAIRRFRRLGVGYEQGKALTFQAIAARRRGRPQHALALFGRARELFAKERNRLWEALIDLYRAVVFLDRGEHARARRLLHASLEVFDSTGIPAKAALCRLMLAKAEFAAGEFHTALDETRRAAAEMVRSRSVTALWQADFLEGQVLEASADFVSAFAAYRRAHGNLENQRTMLRAEGLKIAFLKDKLAVLESLVALSMDARAVAPQPKLTFSFAEQSKSRSLADLIAASGRPIPPQPEEERPEVRAVLQLRERLNSFYRRIELAELVAEGGRASLDSLRRETRQCEEKLAAVLGRMQSADEEFRNLQGGGAVTTEQVRARLGESVLLEYFAARGQLHAAVIDKEVFSIVPLGPLAPIQQEHRMLQFQLSKYRLGAEYSMRFASSLQRATLHHLREMHRLLIEPLAGHLGRGHLVIVPHAFLHYVPFHALWDGSRHLLDAHTLTYWPSATVFHLCSSRPPPSGSGALIMGVPDRFAPEIGQEIRAVAECLPGARVFSGAEATVERLREFGPSSRVIHLAAHASFRQDNPMLSSIRLGDAEFSLIAVYGLRLSADLVALSGCSTGLSTVITGDELIGLVRGLLYAGSRSILVSLWDLHDSSASLFMRTFYRQMREGTAKAEAMRLSMAAVREQYPHPFHWAPYVLVGGPE